VRGGGGGKLGKFQRNSKIYVSDSPATFCRNSSKVRECSIITAIF
jgi:hypothetical protein